MRLMWNVLNEGIDVLHALKIIRVRQLLPDNQCKQLLNRYSEEVYQTRRERLVAFCNDLRQGNNIHGVLDILRLISPRQMTQPVRTNVEVRYSFHLYKFFSEIKGNLDTGNDLGGLNRIQYCENFSASILRKAAEAPNVQRRQFEIDRYVTMEFLHIQQLRDGGFEARERLLDNMMQNLPDGVDRNYADLMYQLKIATSKVNARDLHDAELRISDVLGRVQFCNNSFLRAIIFHDSSYVYRCVHSNTGDPRYVDKIANMTYKAIQALEEDIPPETSPWGKILLLQMAKIYCGIDSNLNVHNEDPLPPRDKLAASEIVKQLRRDIKNMESRREMFFQLCQARIYEDDEDFEMAMYCATRALVLATLGGYYPSDRENIEAYQTRLVLRVLPPNL